MQDRAATTLRRARPGLAVPAIAGRELCEESGFTAGSGLVGLYERENRFATSEAFSGP